MRKRNLVESGVGWGTPVKVGDPAILTPAWKGIMFSLHIEQWTLIYDECYVGECLLRSTSKGMWSSILYVR